jgi:hypothetical protein
VERAGAVHGANTAPEVLLGIHSHGFVCSVISPQLERFRESFQQVFQLTAGISVLTHAYCNASWSGPPQVDALDLSEAAREMMHMSLCSDRGCAMNNASELDFLRSRIPSFLNRTGKASHVSWTLGRSIAVLRRAAYDGQHFS